MPNEMSLFKFCLKVKIALIAVRTNDSFKITDLVFIVFKKMKTQFGYFSFSYRIRTYHITVYTTSKTET